MPTRAALLVLLVPILAGCEKPPARESLTTADSTAPARVRLPVEHWGRQLASSSRSDQQGALGMLGEYQEESVAYIPAIARFLESSDDSLGFSAAWALAKIGHESQAALVRALSNRSPAIRRRAAYGLGEMGAEAVPTVPHLTRMADGDPVIEVRHMAQWAMDQITNRRMVADPDIYLRAGLGASDVATRIEAIRRLGASHPSEASVSELIRLLGDSVEVIRYAAIDALVEKGTPALPSLTMALSSPRRIVRSGAMMAMARMRRRF